MTVSKAEKINTEEQAKLFAEYNYGGDATKGALYRGYYEGAMYGLQKRNDEIKFLRTQLKIEVDANENLRREHAKELQLRNELIACIEAIRENVLVKQMPLNYFEWQRVETLIKRAKGINQNETSTDI